jgi:hypothetical protein
MSATQKLAINPFDAAWDPKDGAPFGLRIWIVGNSEVIFSLTVRDAVDQQVISG